MENIGSFLAKKQKRLQKAVNEICRNEKQVAQNRANFINKKKSSDLER